MDVSRLSPAEVAELLRREKIISEKGIGVIVDNEVDGEALLLLEDDEDFAEIGIKLSDTLQLRKFIAKHIKTAEQPVTTEATEQSVSFMYHFYDYYFYDFCFTKPLPENQPVSESGDEMRVPHSNVSTLFFNIIHEFMNIPMSLQLVLRGMHIYAKVSEG